jgi:hypothetical protein
MRLGTPALAGLRMLVFHRKQLGEEWRLAKCGWRVASGQHGRKRDQRAASFGLRRGLVAARRRSGRL